MLLVDTSVWIDHLRRAEPGLVDALEADAVAVHPLVVEELAAGSLRDRGRLVGHLERLVQLPVLTHVEYLALVDRRRLWGRGLSPIDLHLLGSALVVPGTELWTRDRRLRVAADDLGLATRGEGGVGDGVRDT